MPARRSSPGENRWREEALAVIFVRDNSAETQTGRRVVPPAKARAKREAVRGEASRDGVDAEDSLALSTLMVSMRVGRSNAEPLAAAAALAERIGSRVVGVAARQVSANAYVRGAGFEPADYNPRKFLEQATEAEQEFRSALSKVESLDWRVQMTFGPACEYVADEARSADLVVASADARDRTFFPSGQAEAGDLVMRLGRPILTAPPGAAAFSFRQAVVCFKDVREARRALADSLPILQTMTRVHVVEVAERGGVEDARRRLGDVTAWLARNRVDATSDALTAKGGAAEALAAVVQGLKADLIVAGAFGHSRLREWAFGGVTRDLLLRSDCCVLSSH
jgi:nucleotide-binding universal stress UspA family protein